MANIEDKDYRSYNATTHQDLHCFKTKLIVYSFVIDGTSGVYKWALSCLIREMEIGHIDHKKPLNTLSRTNQMVTTYAAGCQQLSVKI